MTSEPYIAQGAFVSAVAEALVLQNRMLELQKQLQQLDARAERANDAALRERGFDEGQADPEAVLNAQEEFLMLAIAKSGLPEDAPVIRAARQQVSDMRREYARAVQAEADAFGSLSGPEL